MNYILHIETSTKVCSVALGGNGNLIGYKEEISEKYIHAERLTILINELIQENNISFNDLSAIAVSKGPGSYTGLRIGVSTAKGLCYALNIPLISIDSLFNLFLNFKQTFNDNNENNIVIPMIDARRDEVYTATFLDDGSVLNKTRAKIIDAAFFIHYSNYKKVHLIGDGCLKFKGRFKQSNLILHEDLLCSSSSMTNCIYEKFQKKEHENTAYFEPFYLKDFKPF
tara:strand:- start:222 stop:899 length:678 start_codon:yes stop_codon:yes gene_type:complete